MYIEKKKIGKNEYNYLKISVRLKNKIKTKTIAYLGKVPMNKQEIKDKIDRIPKSKIKEIEQELKKDIDINKEFLNKVQLKKLEQLKKWLKIC